MSPRWFAQHLISMALHKNEKIKIVVVKNLKETTKTLLKVSAIILGVKTSALDEFYEKQIRTQPELIKNFRKIQPSIDVSIKQKKKEASFVETPAILLKKTSNSSRSFVPMDVDDDESSPANLPLGTSGYIPFSKLNVGSSSLQTNSQLPLYRPIKIKKVVGNSNRKEKKS